MKIIRRISSIIIGSVFFVAGLLKLMDPVGAGLVVTEYYHFFHLGFLDFSAFFAAEALSLFETVLGAALVTGICRRISGIVSAVTLALFTIVTLILLIANPNMDCGCFGQALHLSHLQSFLKNVVLCLLWVLAFVPFVHDEPRKLKYVGFAAASLSAVAFMVYSLFNLPLADFTPFAPGAELAGEYAEISENSPVLSFSDASGNYADSLALAPQVLVVSVYSPDKLEIKNETKINSIMDTAQHMGIPALRLVAEPSIDSYLADRRMLMSLNRANGGITYLADGQVVAKWTPRSFPSSEELSSLMSKDPIEALMEYKTPRRLKLQGFLLYSFAVMLLL